MIVFMTRAFFFPHLKMPIKKNGRFLKYSKTGLFKKRKDTTTKTLQYNCLEKHSWKLTTKVEHRISRDLMCIAQVTGVLGKAFSQHTFLATWADERKFLGITAKPSEQSAAVCTHLVGSRRTTCLSKKTRTGSGIFLWLLEKFAAWKQHIWAAIFWTEKRIRT